MTEEMIERVAKAMFECRPAYADTFGKVRWTWEMADENSKAYWRDLARAAIEAMREPTEAMVEAGAKCVYGGDPPRTTKAQWRQARDEAIDTYHAMIDAGLATII